MHLVAIVWRFPPRLEFLPQRERRLAPQRLPAEYARTPIPSSSTAPIAATYRQAVVSYYTWLVLAALLLWLPKRTIR